MWDVRKKNKDIYMFSYDHLFYKKIVHAIDIFYEND